VYNTTSLLYYVHKRITPLLCRSGVRRASYLGTAEVAN
jgi:hypothetical protein